MKCLKKSKVCKPSVCFQTIKGNYICSGISSKPSKFGEDRIWLCLKGALAKTSLEMTKGEALGIVSVLAASLLGLGELEKEVSHGT
jgi:hypothetical protein